VCGLTGFLAHRPVDGARALVEQMSDRLRHRGPDGAGFYVDETLALGLRRLSIIDRRTGTQPVANEAGTVWAALNGEIYNHRELRATLERQGHRFRSNGDTEVLVHLWEEHGAECVQRLDGMFALAIWDAGERVLFLARDRMGEKPLYYAATPSALVFGSELRALLEHPAVPCELSLEALAAYLAYEYVPDPLSMIAGVVKLPPGHALTARPGGEPSIVRYWDVRFAPDPTVGEGEWRERVLQQLETSVRHRLIADVPVGFFLSGGVDSSAVVALASRTWSGRALKTFSLGFPEAGYDESAHAAAVARQFGTDHHELRFDAGDACALLEKSGDLFDEPLVDGSFLPTYALSRFAREDVTVTLSGDGGDEVFCGYPTFLVERWLPSLARVPRPVMAAIGRGLDQLPASAGYVGVDVLLKRLWRGLSYSPPWRSQVLLGGLTPDERAGLLARDVAAACAAREPYDLIGETLAGAGTRDPMERAIYQHCKFYLAGQNLPNVDRASMACGLEVRAPFLDHAMVELAGRIPSRLKVHGVTTKYILKEALRGVLPPAILGRRKQGFGVPIGPWLRGPLRGLLEEWLAPERVAEVGLFEPATAARLVSEHVSGRRSHQRVLWALLVFEAWRERYLPGARWRA
jgi:asparagine synthase (glutamine-hydrolysing)